MLKPIVYYLLFFLTTVLIEIGPPIPTLAMFFMAVYHVGYVLGVPSILIHNVERISHAKKSLPRRMGLLSLSVLYVLLAIGFYISPNLNEYIPTYVLISAIFIILFAHFYILWKASHSLLLLENKLKDRDKLIVTFLMFICLPLFYLFLYRRYSTARIA